MVHSTSFSIARCFQIFNEKEMAYFVDDLFDLHNVREVYDRSIDLGANLFKKLLKCDFYANIIRNRFVMKKSDFKCKCY